MTYLTNLEQLAHEMGVRVRYAPPLPGTMWGVYEHRFRFITLRPGMGMPQLVTTFTHELGHAHFGHSGHHPKTERAANRWAARKLLTVDLLKEHSVASADTMSVAASLGVLPSVVEAFIDTLSMGQIVDLMNYMAELHT
ncbi:hypothetical protein D3791_10540 [Glutamicibacter mishrai]|uniref:IrrE N-terminal-like domain-containing protein n=2 Tax=Glutamicibacter mishrai TaxID=1775880 RepID=A0A6H0SK59_9MICC|nr:hypothetical protein D3791_10540 [Glutamicibacter mishrai]